MTKFNRLFAKKFSGCPLLTTFTDPHQGVEVKVYLLPGNYELVGVSHGGDCSVANPQYCLLSSQKKILGLLADAARGIEVGVVEVKKYTRVALSPVRQGFVKLERRSLDVKKRARVTLQRSTGGVRRKLLKP